MNSYISNFRRLLHQFQCCSDVDWQWAVCSSSVNFTHSKTSVSLPLRTLLSGNLKTLELKSFLILKDEALSVSKSFSDSNRKLNMFLNYQMRNGCLEKEILAKLPLSNMFEYFSLHNFLSVVLSVV